MDCPECGSPLADNAKFCSLCFTRFDVVAQPASTLAPTLEPEAQTGFDIPDHEAAQLASFHSARPTDTPPVALRDTSTKRKVVVIGGGAAISVTLGVIMGYVGVPLSGFIAAFSGGFYVGYTLREEGGRWGALAAALPAIVFGLIAVAFGTAILGSAMTEMPKAAKDVPMDGFADALRGVLLTAALIGVAMQAIGGLFGGWAGEHVGDTLS